MMFQPGQKCQMCTQNMFLTVMEKASDSFFPVISLQLFLYHTVKQKEILLP